MIDREAIKRIVHDTMVSYAGQEGGTPRIDWYLLRNELVEALTSAGEGAVPVGWQLVPKEPTQDMEVAGNKLRYHGACNYSAFNIYLAMIAAAPHPPRQDGAREGDACPSCKGRGTEADYVGYEMKCVEVECSACHGSGLTTPPAPDEAVEAEREACARLCEHSADSETMSYGRYFASAIRARSRRDVGGG